MFSIKMKQWGEACRPRPYHRGAANREVKTEHTMTTKQYLAALKKLGLTPASKATAAALGISLRHGQRIAAGAPVPAPVALLLRAKIELLAR
jgi:hypothetical protein